MSGKSSDGMTSALDTFLEPRDQSHGSRSDSQSSRTVPLVYSGYHGAQGSAQTYHPAAIQYKSASSAPQKVPISAPTPIADSSISENQVGLYRFIKTLGKGTFGKVKLAEHILTRERVAIKIIEKANIKTKKQKTSVDREVRLMKLLNHPHIVSVLDVYESKDYIWIVMEHASSGELFDYIIKNGMIKENEARTFFRQILSAVDYCHRNSIIHRDLKPENLLLDTNHNIKIIDFGFGNTFHRDRLLDTYCGSPFYAAPEMIQGIRYIGPEVDIWSLGVILFALLSGRLPFDASTMNELYEKIAKGRYVCPNHFSPEVVHLISRMLHVDPKSRATLDEVRQHIWVNTGYNELIEAYIPRRPIVVTQPDPESLQELISYGFREEDARQVLSLEVGLHPVTSLYHLIDEARHRRDMTQQSTAPPTLPSHPIMTATPTAKHVLVPSPHPSYQFINGTQPQLIHHPNQQYRVPCVNIHQRPGGSQSSSAQPQTPQLPYVTRLPRAPYTTPSPKSPFIATEPTHAYGIVSPPIPSAYLSQSRPTPMEPRKSTAIPMIHRPASGAGTETSGVQYRISAPTPPSTPTTRPIKGLFNFQTTSTRSYGSLCGEIERVLCAHQVTYNHEPESLIYICDIEKGNRFEIELQRVDGDVAVVPASGAGSCYGGVVQQDNGNEKEVTFDLFLRRLRGNLWTHKRVCGRLLEEMNL